MIEAVFCLVSLDKNRQKCQFPCMSIVSFLVSILLSPMTSKMGSEMKLFSNPTSSTLHHFMPGMGRPLSR